jgi:hypothetical protein
MSLVDSPDVQRRRVANAQAVERALVELDAVTYPEGDEQEHEDLTVARSRLVNWLTEQPDYVRSSTAGVWRS